MAKQWRQFPIERELAYVWEEYLMTHAIPRYYVSPDETSSFVAYVAHNPFSLEDVVAARELEVETIEYKRFLFNMKKNSFRFD